MGFTEDIAKLSEQVRNNAAKAVSEQATKFALIVPFLKTIGYDVYDPTEVIPEYIADFATINTKQHKKVDFAIAINGNIVMILEAKASGKKPESHDGQLRAYFNALITTKIGIVTNGIEYRFFTDLSNKNVMDDEPFFSFNILKYDKKDVENLTFFHRDNFDATAITSHAEEMVYVSGMTQLIGNFLRSPSDDFIRFLVSELKKSAPKYDFKSPIVASVINKFRPIVKKSIQRSLVDLVTSSLDSDHGKEAEINNVSLPDEEGGTKEDTKMNTTEEELAAFKKIENIVQTAQNYKYEVQYKDTVSYFGINLGKVTWWILRLYLSSAKKSIVVRLNVDEVKLLAPEFIVKEVPLTSEETVSKITISSIEDLDQLASVIRKSYEVEAEKH